MWPQHAQRSCSASATKPARANIDFCEPALRVRQRILDCENELGNPDHLLVIEVEPSDAVHTNKRDEVLSERAMRTAASRFASVKRCPGRFPGLVDLSDPLDATRFARNPRIARVCSDLSFGQELGEGIRRMFEEMRQAGLDDPIYRQASSGVHLTLLAEPVNRELDARLSERAGAIMAALREGNRLSTGEVAEVLETSRPVAQRELHALRDAEKIEWVGTSPATRERSGDCRPLKPDSSAPFACLVCK